MISAERFGIFCVDTIIVMALALIGMLIHEAYCDWVERSDDRKVRRAIRMARRGTSSKVELKGICLDAQGSEWQFEAALYGCRMQVGRETTIFPPYKWLSNRCKNAYFASIGTARRRLAELKEKIRKETAELKKINGSSNVSNQATLRALDLTNSIRTSTNELQKLGESRQRLLKEAILNDKKAFAGYELLFHGEEITTVNRPRERYLVRYDNRYYVVLLDEKLPKPNMTEIGPATPMQEEFRGHVIDVLSEYHKFNPDEIQLIRENASER